MSTDAKKNMGTLAINVQILVLMGPVYWNTLDGANL